MKKRQNSKFHSSNFSMARMTPCLHTRLSLSKNGLGSNEEEEEIPKCRNSSRSGCLELYTHIHIYIYPPPPLHWTACFENAAFQPTVTRILRAGIRGCLKFFRLLAREFLAQSCQAAVLMKRYRRNRGFERVSLKISQHLAFQIRDVRRYRIQQVSESAGKVFFEFG